MLGAADHLAGARVRLLIAAYSRLSTVSSGSACASRTCLYCRQSPVRSDRTRELMSAPRSAGRTGKVGVARRQHAGGCALEEARVDFARAGVVRPVLDDERQVLDPVLDVEWVEADRAAPSIRPHGKQADRSALEIGCERRWQAVWRWRGRTAPVCAVLRPNALLRSSECNPHGLAVRVLGHDALRALRRSAPGSPRHSATTTVYHAAAQRGPCAVPRCQPSPTGACPSAPSPLPSLRACAPQCERACCRCVGEVGRAGQCLVQATHLVLVVEALERVVPPPLPAPGTRQVAHRATCRLSRQPRLARHRTVRHGLQTLADGVSQPEENGFSAWLAAGEEPTGALVYDGADRVVVVVPQRSHRLRSHAGVTFPARRFHGRGCRRGGRGKPRSTRRRTGEPVPGPVEA